MKDVNVRVVFLLVIFLPVLPASLAGDTIDRALSVRDGDTLVSAGGSFELGFFPLGSSRERYLSIRFRNVPVENVVWVANSRSPLNGSTGVLRFGRNGNLVIQDETGGTVWSSSSTATGAGAGSGAGSGVNVTNPVAQLLDSGNLVIRDGDANQSDTSYLWQSFDEPGNSLIPGMRISVNLKTGFSRNLTSWRRADDPFPGNYTLRMDAEKLPKLVLLQGSNVMLSTGAWDGQRFSGVQDIISDDLFTFDVGSDGDEVYYSFQVSRNSTYATLKLQPNGQVQRLLWNDRTATWDSFLRSTDECTAFGLCGPYAVCNISMSPICQCPRGFRAKSPGFRSGGCERAAELQCGGDDGFLPLREMKLPDLRDATVDLSVGEEECRQRCARDCACTAYARADVREGRAGCITWSGDLIDLRTIGTQAVHVRVPASVLDADPTTDNLVETKSKRSRATMVGASVAAAVVVLLLALCGGGIWIKKKKSMVRKKAVGGDKRKHISHVSIIGEDGDPPLVDFETVAAATNSFSLGNKVGEGGFGVVYKGILDGGQEIAVKRLSWTSVQGVNEFMNEARLIAKLQHKNLVKLLGCCIRGEERMLIYEYMQNKSLDSFIFDEGKRSLLEWRTRLDIILGIARGLMYLHHDSRFKIIHRDLKASNILLDGAMIPKISDFGTARIFGADQNVESTKRVVGTYGYMSPEYAINGIISVKSDVFSFGVLTLEILTGIKNRGIYESEPHLNLLSHTWKLWQEGKCLDLVDATLASSWDATQMRRCIQVALLCVQEHSFDRPTMSTVVTMLISENSPLPVPKHPGFLLLKSNNLTEVSSSNKQEFTENSITMTGIEGR